MNQKCRGYCVIINNSDFLKSDTRTGTEKDAGKLYIYIYIWKPRQSTQLKYVITKLYSVSQ